MVDENVNVEEKPNVETSERTTPEVKEEVNEKVDYSNFVDKEAVEAINQNFSSYKQETENKLKELDRIKKAIIGEDVTTGMSDKEKERFFQDLAENPTETIKRITRETASESENKELKEIQQWKKQQELAQANASIMGYLKANDPEFDNVFNNMANYLKPEEFEAYQNMPDGFETAYAKAKTRMSIDNKNKVQQTQAATNTAKNMANRTANSEIPSSSGGRDEVEPNDLDNRINSNIREGKWNKGEGFSQHDTDIFAQFQRDVYGIKPNR